MTFDADRAEYVGANQAKANFRGAYDAAGPAEYLTALAALDYRIPDEAAESVLELAEQLRREGGLDRVTVLDVGCSYGINAAVLSYRTTFRALSERYHGRDLDESADPAIVDRHFFAQCERDSRVDVIGLDIASNAVRYGVRAGLLSEGVVENLEEEKLSPQGAQSLAKVDLVISTGCVGYVTERTFSQVVEAASASGGAPVVASFVLRMFPYDGVARSLKKRGWSTQKWPGSFRQRRFKDDGERRSVLAELERRGLEPGEREARDGYLHAELFVSYPTRFRFGQREAGEAAASA